MGFVSPNGRIAEVDRTTKNARRSSRQIGPKAGCRRTRDADGRSAGDESREARHKEFGLGGDTTEVARLSQEGCRARCSCEWIAREYQSASCTVARKRGRARR